jgi:acyl-CoA thioester hydrolase
MSARQHAPVFFAPFVSSTMTVEPAWIDYNGHLNMAYYNVLFDRGTDQAFLLLGIGPDYVRERAASSFTAEAHVRYLRELKTNDPVRITLQLLDYDDKRVHFFQEMHHVNEDFLAATCEQLALHIDMNKRRVAAFPDDVLMRLAEMKAAHGVLPRPEAAGRQIRIPARI